MTRLRKIYLIIAGIVLLQTTFGIIGGLIGASTSGSDMIFPGVFISGLKVGNLTPAEAEARLRQTIEPAAETPFVLRYKDRQWRFYYSDLGARFDPRKSVWVAYQFGREANPVLRAINLFKLRRNAQNIKPVVIYDENRFNSFLTELSGQINQDKLELDTPALRRKITEAVSKFEHGPIEVPVREK